MSRFRNVTTDVVVSVDDSKDERFRDGRWESADSSAGSPRKAPAKKAPAKKAAPRNTTSK